MMNVVATRPFLLGILLLSTPSAAFAQCERTLLESRAPNGDPANLDSIVGRMSADGRWYSFYSLATNLIPGVGTPYVVQLYLQDRTTGALSLLSANAAGIEGDQSTATFAEFSSDGRFVVFDSLATNLVAGDTNGAADVFLRDLQAGTIERISVGPGGVQGNALSFQPSISENGRWVVFASNASNLVANDGNGSMRDTFLYDRLSGSVELVSIGLGGVPSNGQSNYGEVSDDGRRVVFQSLSTNLVAGDTNGFSDIFLRDRVSGTTSRIDVAPDGTQGNGRAGYARISADGNTIAYSNDASNLVPGDTNNRTDVFVFDRPTATTSRIDVSSSGAQANDECSLPYLSGAGRFVVFSGAATNLVPGDSNGQVDAFWHDLDTGHTRRVSLGENNVQGDQGSAATDVSDDGRVVAFNSFSGNLVSDDTNGVQDTFIRELWAAPLAFCPATPNSTGAPAALSIEGPPLVSGGGFELTAGPVPNQVGLFFAGSTAIQIPFGNGVRCAGGSLQRLYPVQHAQNQTQQRFFDFQTAPESVLVPGSTWIFQLWFRDPMAGGAGFNLSSALQISVLRLTRYRGRRIERTGVPSPRSPTHLRRFAREVVGIARAPYGRARTPPNRARANERARELRGTAVLESGEVLCPQQPEQPFELARNGGPLQQIRQHPVRKRQVSEQEDAEYGHDHPLVRRNDRMGRSQRSPGVGQPR